MKHLRSSQYRNGCRSVPTACGRVLSRVRRQRDAGVGLVVLVLCGLGAVGAQAQVQSIAGITVTYQTVANTNQNYSTQGGGSSSFPADTTYNIRFNEGSSNHMYLAEVMVGGRTFDSIALAGQINIARSSRAAITGAHHIVLYEQASVSGTNLLLKSSYAATMEESLRSAMINHGADNVFSDQGDGNGNNNNIQRIDYLFPDGLPVHSHIEQRGFLVMDRGGNDRFKIAAVTALDANGKPAGFGPVVSVLETQWGTSGITLDTIVMRGYTEDGDVQHPSASLGSQPLSGVFLSWQALGLKTNDLIYGYALAANDATTNGAYWTQTDNSTYFPVNTSPSSTYGGLDLISGGLMFYDEELNVTLGDRAWEDLNANGLQDAGEPGLSNVLVHVYDSVSNLAAVVRTDTNGVWRSPGHGPGAYFATYVCPEGYQFTTRYAGTNSAIDSNADPLTGQTAVYPMSNGQTNLTLDAGFYRLASLGDLTWEDSNVDGQQDIGEPGLGGVVVRLYDAMSNVIATSTSSMVGAYAFNDVRPGTYSVGFTAPAGYQFTAADIGNDATDSDADLATGETVPITLTSGQTNLSVDAGFYQPVSLGDFTWVDTNGNGQQDAGEPGLAGVVVRLYDAASNVTATTTSSVAGAYAFSDLLPGSYSVGFTAPAGYPL
ncbi:MAG: SdrD B-like domain-containing protein, partial [Kiritimatiellae bacterium]|nr:SdrD B-like domain-containing protein [Kiritimatiellia bacterium]